MVNLFDPQFDPEQGDTGFAARRSRIGYELGTERIGMSIWEIPPGRAAYPYHFHLAEEEVLIVLQGAPHLRGPDGWRQLGEGEILRFAPGPEGAHQVDNRGTVPVRLLALSTQDRTDVVVYPDSDKIGVLERRPRGGGLRRFFRRGDAVAYGEGETEPDRPVSF
jgi:uncharacterized cupin superfamily protein